MGDDAEDHTDEETRTEVKADISKKTPMTKEQKAAHAANLGKCRE